MLVRTVQRKQTLAFHTKWERFFYIYLHMQCTVPPGSCSCLQVMLVFTGTTRERPPGRRHTHCLGRVRCQWSFPFPADSPPHMCNSQNPPLSLCWSGLWSFSCGRQHLHSWVRGLMARRKQQQVERARQTTAAWQPASVSIGLQGHLIWPMFEGENILE